MTRRDRTLLVIAIVLFAFAGIYLAQTGKKKSVSPLPSPQPAAELLTEAIPGDRAVALEEGPWGRNPFFPEGREKAGERVASPEGLQVRAIITGRSRSVATIDGHTVFVGEKLGEETVIEILPDAVILGSGGRKRVLKIREPSVSVEAKDVAK